MSMTLDQRGDSNGQEIFRFSKLYDFPEYVKSASLDILRPADAKPAEFADIIGLNFPCGTKAATYVSTIFFLEKQAELPPGTAGKVGRRIDEMARYWGIEPDVKAAKERFANRQKSAEIPDSDYALVWRDDATGAVTRKYPMRSALETKRAAEYLFKYRDDIPFSMRNVMAQKILVKVAQHGAGLGDLDDFVEQQAGRGVCDPKALDAMLRNRAYLCKDATVKDLLMRTADSIPGNAVMLSPPQLIKLATVIDQVDRVNLHLVGKYTDTHPRPESVIFGCLFKAAKSELARLCTLKTGSVYDCEDLARVRIKDISDLFGAGFAEAVSGGLRILGDKAAESQPEVDPQKLATQLETLPLPDAELFDALMREQGIRPRYQDKSAAVGFSPRQLAAMAEM